MFVFIFVLLFANYFQVNCLKCMQEKASLIGKINNAAASFKQKVAEKTKLVRGEPTGCFVMQDMTEQFPSDEELNKQDNCELRSSTKELLKSSAGYSCYAEVSIDYRSGEMIVQFDMLRDKDDKLFKDVSGDGKKVVVQYEIKGDFNSNVLGMITRIQCDTKDNCAVDEVRQLLPNLKKAEDRLKVFDEIDKLLNTAPPSTLICLNNDNEPTLKCLTGAEHCKYELEKAASTAQKSCKVVDLKEIANKGVDLIFIPDTDIEFRYSKLLEHDDDVTLADKESFEFMFECKREKCNSEENAAEIAELLSSFAEGPAGNSDSADTASKQSQSNSPFAHVIKKKKSGSTSLVSYPSMILFVLLSSCFI